MEGDDNVLKKREHIFSNNVGDATMTVYNVFQGVQLVYHTVHMDQFDLNYTAEGNYIEIHYCREGRIEQQFEGEYFYLMPGDLSIARRMEVVRDYHFPLCHYHGISIGINMDMVSDIFLKMLNEMQVQPFEIVEKLCGENNWYTVRSEQDIEHIFTELYSVPDNMKEGYFKVKILELFLTLNGKKKERQQITIEKFSKQQVQLANQVAAYLLEHMNQQITITELAKRFHVSDTYIKTSFKGVYGVPIMSYMRIQIMQAAAQLLIHTEQPIAEIAYEFGYNNTSKFAAAFQKIMGDTPSEYRKEHTKYRSK